MKKAGLVQLCLRRVAKKVIAATPSITSSRTLVGAPPPPHLLTRTRSMAVASNSIPPSASASSFPGYGDPCLDLFFNVRWQLQPFRYRVEDGTLEEEEDDSPKINYLKKLLPVAWSHNPLTTLKLICDLGDGYSGGKFSYPRAFYTAVIWLHQNHPRTLLCSLPFIAKCSGEGVGALLQILYDLIQQGQGQEGDPAYKLLHDRAMDLFAEHLKSDIEKMKQGKLEMKPSDFDSDSDDDEEDEDEDEDDKLDGTLDPDAFADLRISGAALYCQSKHHIEINRAVSLFESIAKRLLPPESESSQSQESWERFQREVLGPLNKYWGRQGMFNGRERCPLRTHLEEVKAAAAGWTFVNIKPEAMLPHEIVTFALEDDLREAAELQWKAMVDMYRKQGKFRNCLALCNVQHIVNGTNHWQFQVGLGLLLSQLTEDKWWKGKVMRFDHDSADKLLLHPIQGHDLKSKCEFMRTSCTHSLTILDVHLVLDFILEVAVKENLKPEQMIDKVFVFTDYLRDDSFWYRLYEESRTKFKEQGYEAMPHIFVWKMSVSGGPSMPLTQYPGVTLLKGRSSNLKKFFFDNGGDIGLRNLMEIDIDCKEYQTLSVVD